MPRRRDLVTPTAIAVDGYTTSAVGLGEPSTVLLMVEGVTNSSNVVLCA